MNHSREIPLYEVPFWRESSSYPPNAQHAGRAAYADDDSSPTGDVRNHYGKRISTNQPGRDPVKRPTSQPSMNTNKRTDAVCDICWKTYSKPSSMNRHKRTAHFSSSFACEGCGVVCNREDTLERHRETMHTELGKVTCPQCRVPVRKDGLGEHMATQGCLARARVSASRPNTPTTPPRFRQTTVSTPSLRGTPPLAYNERTPTSGLTPEAYRIASTPPELNYTYKATELAKVQADFNLNELYGTMLSGDPLQEPPSYLPAYQADPQINLQQWNGWQTAQSDRQNGGRSIFEGMPALVPNSPLARHPALVANPMFFNLDGEDSPLYFEPLTSAGSQIRRESVKPSSTGALSRGSPGVHCRICECFLPKNVQALSNHADEHLLRPPRPRYECVGCSVKFVYQHDLHYHRQYKSHRPGQTECMVMGLPDDDSWVGGKLRDKFVGDLREWERLQLKSFVKEIDAVLKAVQTSPLRQTTPAQSLYRQEADDVAQGTSFRSTRGNVSWTNDREITAMGSRFSKVNIGG